MYLFVFILLFKPGSGPRGLPRQAGHGPYEARRSLARSLARPAGKTLASSQKRHAF